MSDVRLVARGSGEESFVVTREQISELVDKAYRRGQNGGFKPRAFECECDALRLNDWSGQQVARAKRLHIVTANHLREERKRRRITECANSELHRQLRAWYGGETVTSLFDTPAHYRGDGHVTCRRAMESCDSQEKVVEPTPMALNWWLTAFQYVWRMWSKGDPEGDALTAICCLRKCMKEVANG